MAYNYENLTLVQQNFVQGLLNLWTYTTTVDNLATVETSGYFVPSAAPINSTDDLTGKIQVGDFINITASNASDIVIVTALNPITVIPAALVPAGTETVSVAVYEGQITWSEGGASLATTVTGVLTTDKVFVSFENAPTEAAYVTQVVPTANTITITLSAANTANDAVINYIVMRAVA